MKLNFTETVEADLEAIADHIAKHSPHQAVRLVRDIRTHCEHLVSFPRAYPLLAEHEESGFRRIVHGSYLIFYIVGKDTIDIVRVIHGAVDYEAILFPDDADQT